MKVFKAVYKQPNGDLFEYKEYLSPWDQQLPDATGCELVHFVVEEDEEYLTLEDGNA